LTSLKRPTAGSESMEIRSLATRAINAERRLHNAQNQLLSSEEKITALNQKSMLTDGKWEARVKEYEARLKAAEERVKRERQGAKERVLELENSLKWVFKHLFLPRFCQTKKKLTIVSLGICSDSWTLLRSAAHN
jgi:predicted  nucleic acid-binding Zn-ribbon protein